MCPATTTCIAAPSRHALDALGWVPIVGNHCFVLSTSAGSLKSPKHLNMVISCPVEHGSLSSPKIQVGRAIPTNGSAVECICMYIRRMVRNKISRRRSMLSPSAVCRSVVGVACTDGPKPGTGVLALFCLGSSLGACEKGQGCFVTGDGPLSSHE